MSMATRTSRSSGLRSPKPWMVVAYRIGSIKAISRATTRRTLATTRATRSRRRTIAARRTSGRRRARSCTPRTRRTYFGGAVTSKESDPDLLARKTVAGRILGDVGRGVIENQVQGERLLRAGIEGVVARERRPRREPRRVSSEPSLRIGEALIRVRAVLVREAIVTALPCRRIAGVAAARGRGQRDVATVDGAAADRGEITL